MNNSLKIWFQILSNGFSADYKNEIQVLYTRIKNNKINNRLPSYQKYVAKKISQYAQYYPDIDLEKFYLDSISEEDLVWFNTQVDGINTLVKKWASLDQIKPACEELISSYLDCELKGTISNTLAKLSRALDE